MVRTFVADEQGREAYERGRAGVLAEAALLAALDAGAAAEQAWACALRWQRWFAGADAHPPNSDALRSLKVDDASAPALDRVLHLHARARWLARDAAAARETLAHHEQACGRTMRWLLSRAWVEVMVGSPASARAAIAELQDAPRAVEAEVVIEAAALRAMGAVLGGDLEEAVSVARRASRMARTESFPQQEYLANVVLARVRRLSGRPFLAARILGVLDRVAPPMWRSWIGWERLMSGDSEGGAGEDRHHANALGALLAALAEGRPPTTDLPQEGLFGTDVHTILGVCGHTDAPGSAVARWRSGAALEVPDGLQALGATDPTAAVALVVALPGARGTRVLALSRAALEARGHRELPPAAGAQMRTDSAIAELALAGPDGLEIDDFFARLYGFEYRNERHRSVRNMLVHRVDRRLESVGTVARENDRIRLVTEHAFFLSDPRCIAPPEERLLYAAAAWGALSSRKAAERLGMPLRTAQEALRRLAEDGAFKVERQQREFVYSLEDTTFQEPTWIDRLDN